MSDFFALLFSDYHSFTIVLYSLIYMMATTFAFKSQKTNVSGNVSINLRFYLMSLFVLVFFFAFNDVGVDTPHYKTYFSEYRTIADISRHFGAVEVGFQYLNIALHFITIVR